MSPYVQSLNSNLFKAGAAYPALDKILTTGERLVDHFDKSDPAEAPFQLTRIKYGNYVPVIPSTPVAISSSVIATRRPTAVDRRVALVIGNSGYRAVQQLPNPSHDAELVGAALRSTGIEDVAVVHDLDRESMVAALKAFARKADAADWAIIYYAGHGIEIGGTNYLIPVDAKLETDRDVPDEAIPLEQMQTTIEGAHKLKLIVLDACRDNPFAAQMKLTVANRRSVAACRRSSRRARLWLSMPQRAGRAPRTAKATTARSRFPSLGGSSNRASRSTRRCAFCGRTCYGKRQPSGALRLWLPAA